MKAKGFSILLSLCTFAINYTFGQKINHDNPNAYALLIGIGSYPAESQWEQLHGDADVQLIKSTLLKIGFHSINILTLVNEEATLTKIKDAFSQLKEKTQVNAIVHIHFSGHGQQKQDFNHDEIDGFDEAFVPYNSPKIYKPKANEGQNLLTDDQLDSLISELRIHLGSEGHLLVTMDACHSGTSTRGRNKSRGTDIIMADPSYIKLNERLKPETKGIIMESIENNLLMAPFVSISSSSPQEKSYEIPLEINISYGLFSYFLCKNLLINKPCLSYAELFHNIANNIKAHTNLQHPQIEGPISSCVYNNSSDQKFGFIRVKEILSDDLVLIDKGILQNVQEGSEIIFYSENTGDSLGQNYLAKGIVEEVSAIDADVQINGNVPAEQLKNAKAVLSKTEYKIEKLRLQLLLKDTEFANRIRKSMDAISAIQWVAQDPDLYFENPEGFANSEFISIYNRDDNLIYQQKINIENEAGEMEKIKTLLLKYQRLQNIKKLEMPSQNLMSDFSINLNGKSMNLYDENIQVKITDTIAFVIKNKGVEAFYFSLLELRPDLSVETIYPEKSKTSSDYYLIGSGVYQSPLFKISPPLGNYCLKLILSTQPIDFNNIDQTRSIKQSYHKQLGSWINQKEYQNLTTPMQLELSSTQEMAIRNYYVKIN